MITNRLKNLVAVGGCDTLSRRSGGVRKSRPINRLKASYFETCDRDDEGHCKPASGGGTSSEKPKPDSKPADALGEKFHDDSEVTGYIAPWNLRGIQSQAKQDGVDIPQDFMDKQTGWAKSLTENEQNAVMQYTTASYEDLNKTLRDKCPDANRACMEKDGAGAGGESKWEMYQLLQNALAKAPAFPETTLHRGMIINDEKSLNGFLDGVKQSAASGKPFTMRGMTSTSLSSKVPDEAIAQYSGGGTKVYMQIKATKGAMISTVNAPQGLEVLLPHGAQYRATGMSRNPDGSHVIHMEQL